MADGEEPVTSVEQPAPSPVPAEPSEQAAETPAEETPAPSEQPAETPAEQVAEPDAETQRLESLVDELVASSELIDAAARRCVRLLQHDVPR